MQNYRNYMIECTCIGMTMKKLTFTTLILIMLISMSACGRRSNQTEEPAEVVPVYQPETPATEEPAIRPTKPETATEVPFEPTYIWEIWTLTDIDVEGWKADIVQLRNHVFRVHPKFAYDELVDLPHNIQIGIAFDKHIDRLLENVPYLTLFEIMAELQRITALLGDNHFGFGTAVPLIRTPDAITFMLQLRENRYPLKFRWFYDGFYLYRAVEREDVIPGLNNKLVAINGIPLENIFSDFIRFMSVENIYDERSSFARYLNSPGILYALGVWEREQTVYTLMSNDGKLIHVTMTESVVPRNTNEYWHLVFHEPLTDNRNDGELPLFLQNSHLANWYTFIEEYGILYIRINLYFPWDDLDFIPHVAELAGEKGESINAVIIDARNNPGGDEQPYHILFNAVAEAVSPGNLFYFMNEGSLSASLLSGGYLYELGAVIVGHPSGQLIDFYAFSGHGFDFNLSLRNTWANIAIPNRFLTIRNHGVAAVDMIFRPHVLIEYTVDVWINNRDPYLEFVLNLLR